MNDKILNTRQENILEILAKTGEISSTELHLQFGKDLKSSRVTIIRDLNRLVELGLIESSGRARKTLYKRKQPSSLLSYVNLENYFDLPLSERKAFKSFQNIIFSKLKNLFTEDEIDFLTRSSLEFKNRMKNFNPTLYRREFERFVIEFSWKSSQIEGNTYDLLETETLLKLKIEAKGHSSHEAKMILNHKAALDFVVENPSAFKKLSLKTVTKLHNLLVKGLGVSTGIRNRQVRITGTSYVPPHNPLELKKTLNNIIKIINATKFPPEKALIAGCMIAYLQPFEDGNKRSSRILANALLLAHGYFPLSYRNVDPTEYVKAMILFYEKNNLYHSKRIFVEQMHFAVENYFIV